MNWNGFRNGFQRVPRQCSLHKVCWGLGPGHIYDGFRTGSNGFRQNAFERKSTGAQAPATFTTGSERAPAGSKKTHVLVKTARRQMSSQEKPGADIGSRPTHRQRRNTYYSNSTAPNEFSGRNFHTAFALSAAKANLQQTMSVSSEFNGAVARQPPTD